MILINLEFYDTFINFNKEQLFEMALKSESFEPEAISTAKQIIEDKNWTKELNILLDIEVEKNTETKARLIKEIEVKAEYYKKAVRLKKKITIAFRLEFLIFQNLKLPLKSMELSFLEKTKTLAFS